MHPIVLLVALHNTCQAWGEVHVKYLSKVQVLSHLLKYKYKYMALFLEKYLSKIQVLLKVLKYKYKYILTKQIL